MVTQKDNHIILPAFATAHSHAFQRALRGRTQRRQTEAGSFWSWRGLMYELVQKLSPEDIFNVSRFAFVELLMSGVTAVGEFHYVHHQPDGTPYDDRVTLADAVIQAAKDAGIRITLIRTAYFRAGHNQALHPAQRRFCDPSVDDVLQDVETLQRRYQDDPMVKIALAAHSIRAVPIEQIQQLAAFARQHEMPFHMHVAEQRREIEECRQEYGRRPVQLLAEHGILDQNFVAIHATHLAPEEIEALGQAKAHVCLCRTTERDLGDGLPRTTDLLKAGVRLCVGVDSHASSDAFEEIRAVELDERSRTEKRTVAADAPQLLEMATKNGLDAIGMADAIGKDEICMDRDDPAVLGIAEELSADMVVFGGMPRAIEQVKVNNKAKMIREDTAVLEKAAAAYNAFYHLI